MNTKGCVLVKEKEWNSLNNELTTLRNTIKPDEINIFYYGYNSRKRESVNVKSTIDLSCGLMSQITNIANLITKRINYIANHEDINLAKIEALEKARKIASNNFAWTIPRKIQAEIDLLKID